MARYVTSTQSNYRRKILKMNSWYKRQFQNKVYYAPFAEWKTKYLAVRNDTVMPTANEIADFLNKLDERDDVGIAETNANGLIRSSFKKDDSLVNLPNGIYLHQKENHFKGIPERLIDYELRDDNYIEVGLTTKVKNDIDIFLENEKVYNEDGVLYKLGILLYGVPGGGKTSFVRNLIKNNFKDNCVVIFLKELPEYEFLRHLKESLTDKLKIFIFEELATTIKEERLSDILDFLDGETSIGKSIVIATTNYPEALPGNIVNRHSRFDKRYRFNEPSKEDRKKIIEMYLKQEVTDEQIDITKSMPASALKELAMLIRLKKMSFEDAVKELKQFNEENKKAFAETQKLGI